MELKLKKRKIVKFGSGYAMLIPMAYIRDENLTPEREYDISIDLSPKEAFYGALPLNLGIPAGFSENVL